MNTNYLSSSYVFFTINLLLPRVCAFSYLIFTQSYFSEVGLRGWTHVMSKKCDPVFVTEGELTDVYFTGVVQILPPEIFPQRRSKDRSRYPPCNCCPYGYHIDLDFVRFCEALSQGREMSASKQRRRERRLQRQSMEVLLGLTSPTVWNLEQQLPKVCTQKSVHRALWRRNIYMFSNLAPSRQT
jgi:hypothetical protein